MSTKYYTTAQDMKFSSFFILAKDFHSGVYDSYVITERLSGKTFTFSHNKVKSALNEDPGLKQSRSTFANGEPFIKLNLNLANEHVTKNLEDSEIISAQLL